MTETIETFNYTYSGAPLTEEIEIGEIGEIEINDMKVELENVHIQGEGGGNGGHGH